MFGPRSTEHRGLHQRFLGYFKNKVAGEFEGKQPPMLAMQRSGSPNGEALAGRSAK